MRASKARSLTTSRTSGSDRGTPAVGGDRDHSDGRLHEPVLLAEVLTQLDPREGGSFLDGTLGAGGHAEAILERTGPSGRLIGLDVDPAALAEARRVLGRFGDRAILVRSNFALLDVVAREHGLAPLDGILLDLGRFVAGVKNQRRRGIDPATRVFQALRIAVNRELENLQQGLGAAVRVLRPGGRLAVISFHSLEDRITKQFFVRESRDCICPPHLPTCVCGHRAGLRVVTRRPLRADSAEVARNPRARSAVLRIAEKIS